MFHVKEKYFEIIDAISLWNSKGIYKQSLNLHGIKGDLKMSKAIRPASVIFNKENRYLFQTKPDIIASGSIVNIYIVYKLSSKTISFNNALKNSLFGATKVIKTNNTIDPHKYIYSGCGLAIHRTGQFTSSDKNLARNVIIFRADLLNSRHATNRTQNILALGLGFIKNKKQKKHNNLCRKNLFTQF